MKKAVISLVIAVGPGLSSLAAQASPAPPPASTVAQFLGLSEAQAARFQQLLHNLQATVGGLERQMSERQQRLERLLSSEPADPALVGATLLEIHALQKQAGRALQSYHESFLTLLTREQEEKTQAVAQAGQLLPAVRTFAEVRLIAPPR